MNFQYKFTAKWTFNKFQQYFACVIYYCNELYTVKQVLEMCSLGWIELLMGIAPPSYPRSATNSDITLSPLSGLHAGVRSVN